eukprot:gnl/MRDRNA2_/MRDRNA2_110239_c0_seq1.p1 gnl/MRDRNA2_/MRDRNA2_110239_c0~~gnl/MRDRNA2_/MRDRNA2_110239_c0_seq1.p1  ORF type:complete len:208 (-),score=55.97 gnl/MRDRNA2_/MRDRNA2_110239_c0_seq1:11-634(-)
MGKSIRSKIKKRFRTAKRQRIEEVMIKPRLAQLNAKIKKIQDGALDEVYKPRPKNAFLHPDAEGAEFPQHTVLKPVDFRSANLPGAQYAFKGNRRKYNAEETEYMKQVATNHPAMEILAGGGGTQRGDIGIIKDRLKAEGGMMDVDKGVAQASSSSSSKAEPSEPPAEVDNKRPPVAKDNLRAQRLEKKRPRAKTKASVKSKVKSKS